MMRITLFRLSMIVLVICYLVMFAIAKLNIIEISALSGKSCLVYVIVVFSFLSAISSVFIVSLFAELVSRIRELNIRVSKSLVEDYINGCFTIFSLSIVELVLVFLATSFETITILYYLVLPLLISILSVLVVLMLSLWRITKLLYKATLTN